MDFEVKMFEKTYGTTEAADTPVDTTAEAQPAETVVETPTETPATEVEAKVESPVTVEEVPTEPSADISLLKELGFENLESLKQALSKQPEILQPEFANDHSKELYELIVNGKEEEVAEILYTKRQLSKLENETSEEKILKAHIKLTNPEFDDSDVEDEYKEKYSLSEDSEFDESKKKREEKRLRQNIKNDVTKAKEFFASKRQELKLPSFEKVSAQDAPQESQDDVFVQLLAENVKNFKGLAPIEFGYKDDNSNIPIRYEWDANKVSEIKTQLEQPHGYYARLATRHYDGTNYNTEQIVKDLYVLENLQQILDTAVSQAVNKSKIEFLQTQKNISNNVPPTEGALPEDLQKQGEKEQLRKLLFG